MSRHELMLIWNSLSAPELALVMAAGGTLPVACRDRAARIRAALREMTPGTDAPRPGLRLVMDRGETVIEQRLSA